MPPPDPSPADLLVRCLSLLSATDQTSWSKEGKQTIEGEVHNAAALQNGGLLSAAFDLIATIAQLARSGSNEGPAEALESAARDLTQPLDQYGTGLSQFTQGLLEETVTALLQTVGLLKAPLKDTDSIEPAASLIALLQQLRRQLCAEPDFRVPGSLVSCSQAVLLGSTEQRAANHNPLPSATPAFRGRDALLIKMQQTLSDPPALGRRSVLVRSRRGMGKTQLVLAYVQKHLAQYDKVLWLSASTPAWRVRFLQLGAYLGVDLITQASWEERATQVRAGIQMYPGRLLLVVDGADESVDLSMLVPSDARGGLHLVVTTSTPEVKLAGSIEVEVPELSDSYTMALLRGSEETGSAASEGNLAAAAAAFKDLTLTVAVAACLFREGAAVPSALLSNADPLGVQSNRKRSEGSGQFWLGRCCYEALRFLEESGKEKALLASTSALVGGWFGPGGITLDLLVSGLQWHIGSRVNSTKVEAALVELSRLGIATRQGDGSVVFPSVLRNYVAADKKRGGHHSMLRALASTSCDWSNSDHFRAVWMRRAELADSYARKQLVLLIGLKTVQFFVAGSGEYSAAEALCTQALAWLGKEEPTWRSEFTAAQAQALAAQRKYAAAAQIWQAQTQAAEPADDEEAFMPKNFRAGVRPLPLDLSQSQDMSVYAPQKTPESPESPGSPDGSLDIFHAALPNLRTTPLPEANGKAETIMGGSEASTPKSALSIVSAFGMPRKRIQRSNTKTPPLRSMSPSAFPSSLRRSTSTPLQRPTPPKTPRSASPHLTRFNTLKNGSPEATAEVLRQEGETLMRATPIVARPASAYQTRRKSWSPSLRTSLEHEQKELVAAKVPEALLGYAAAAACEGDLQGALQLLEQAKEHPATAEGGHLAEVLLRRGRVETALGDWEAGLKSLAEAGEQAEKVWGKEDARRSKTMVVYADALVAAGRTGEAVPLYRVAGDMLAKEIGPTHLVVLEVRQRQATAEVAGGATGEGVSFLESGYTAKQAALLPNSPVRATGLQALAAAYAAQRRMDAALACWEESAKIQAVALPSRSPSVARSLLLGANLYQAKGRKKEAGDAVKRALAIEESIQPTGSSHLALSLAQASTVMRAQKRYDEALAVAQRSVALHGKTSPASPLEVAASLDALASVHMCRKRYTEAQPLLNRALTIHEETKTATRGTADLLTNMAECAEAQGRKEKAQQLLERAVGILENLGVREDDPVYAKSKKKLAGFKRPLGGFCCSAPSTM